MLRARCLNMQAAFKKEKIMETKFEIIVSGNQREFLLPFKAYRFEDVKVYIDDQLQSQGYSLSHLGGSQGVKVTFTENLGSRARPATLRIERLSRISPWVRFHDHEPLKAAMLNANTDHSYAILQEHRRLCEQAGDMSHNLSLSEKLLSSSQHLNEQSMRAKEEAVQAMNKAQEAAQKVESISNLEAKAVKMEEGVFSPSVTNVQQGLNGLAFSIMPVGSLLIWLLNRPPQGFLQAKGQLLDRAHYPELWALIATSGDGIADSAWNGRKGCFSVGNGTTTFRLPDLRDQFIRSIGSNRGVGTLQAQSIQLHHHEIGRTVSNPADTGNTDYSIAKLASTNRNGAWVSPHAKTASVGGSETRPKNIALNFCIKVKNYF